MILLFSFFTTLETIMTGLCLFLIDLEISLQSLLPTTKASAFLSDLIVFSVIPKPIATFLFGLIFLLWSKIKSGFLGSFHFISTPTTFLILFWLHYENNSLEKISNHVSYTLLYVLPTLPMFLVFPYLINKFGFYWSIIISVLITTFFIFSVHLLTKKYGYKII